jgi:hypothetical protein
MVLLYTCNIDDGGSNPSGRVKLTVYLRRVVKWVEEDGKVVEAHTHSGSIYKLGEPFKKV